VLTCRLTRRAGEKSGTRSSIELQKFWVLDRHGNVVVDNVKLDRAAALKQFAALLKDSAPK
jgi:hypothetical protein